jgi:hypothetical protein
MCMAGTIALQTEQTLQAPSLSCDSQNTSRLLLQLLHPLCTPLRSPTASQTSVLILPVFPPFLFFRQNRLVRRPPKSSNNCVGIYISYTFYHLLHHFSSAVPTLKIVLTPPGCGFDAGPLSLRLRVRSERVIFLPNDALPKAANCISDVRDATNSIHPWVCVARRPRSCVGGVMDAS